MRCPNGVDVMSLHQKQVPLQEIKGDGSPKIGMMFMAIDTANLDGRRVQSENTILNMQLSKTDALADVSTSSNRVKRPIV